MLKRSERGDTLVEVMIAMSVVSLVLAAAYVSANRSLQASRQAQERGEAIRMVESQAEFIKVFAQTSGSGIFDNPGQAFCIGLSGPNKDKKETLPGAGPFASTVTLENDDFSTYPAACKESLYSVSARYTPPVPVTSLNDYFEIFVRWPRLGGQNSEVRMVYRVHQ